MKSKQLFTLGRFVFAFAFLGIGIYGFFLNQTGLRHSKEVFEFAFRGQVDVHTYNAVVFVRSFLFILCGGLIMSNQRTAMLLSLCAIFFAVLCLANPLKPGLSSFDLIMNWQLCLKLAASVGGVLLLATKGKAKRAGD